MGDAIKRGELIVTDTKRHLPHPVGNGLNRTSCHRGRGRRLYQQPRPDYAARAKDWPKGDKPKDAR